MGRSNFDWNLGSWNRRNLTPIPWTSRFPEAVEQFYSFDRGSELGKKYDYVEAKNVKYIGNGFNRAAPFQLNCIFYHSSVICLNERVCVGKCQYSGKCVSTVNWLVSGMRRDGVVPREIRVGGECALSRKKLCTWMLQLLSVQKGWQGVYLMPWCFSEEDEL